KMRLSEGKYRSKRAIPHASHVITKSNTRVTMTFERERATARAFTRARVGCVSFVYSAWPEVGGATLGLSYRTSRGRRRLAWANNQQVRNHSGRTENKTRHWCSL